MSTLTAHVNPAGPAPVNAVRTTGIYCYSSCSARPLPRNSVWHLSPAAAESAGFRPCLLCRPHADQPSGWRTGTQLVDDALQFIGHGQLDHHTEDDLAVSLGVSARHLRRLFAQSVGATPSAVARSRRAHLARRLLDETDVSVTDIAYMAGFGSPRQMQRTVRDVFGFGPSELRSRRRRRDQLPGGPGPDRVDAPPVGGLDVRLRLPHDGSFDFADLMSYVGSRLTPGVDEVSFDDAAAYSRTIRLEPFGAGTETRAGIVTMRAIEGEPAIELAVALPEPGPLAAIVADARRFLALDTDTRAAVAHLGRDPLLRDSIVVQANLVFAVFVLLQNDVRRDIGDVGFGECISRFRV